MTRARGILTILCLHLVLVAGAAKAEDNEKDVGKESVGRLKATLYIGTDGDVGKLGEKVAAVDEVMVKRLRRIEKMRFKHYRKLGEDTQSVFRSYENWLTPLKPSEEILLSFESRGRSSDDGLRLDLELWQHRRKVMKSDPVLHRGRPLLILGPKWRGGSLIIAVEIMAITPKK
ncbi:MAG: hypothetical protein KJO21_10720 [Verrucomicrobiae bacterium]|nr:hypothetical protein [Verrucomicrobiae bacterium]NNJ42757.1 hypothetical protein [Akkermansiaceae bacterium]